MRKGERRGSSGRAVRRVKTTTRNRRSLDIPPSGSQAALRQDNAIPPERSAMMAGIGRRNTAPEIAVRRVLHGLGLRFRLHRHDLPGTPDIVLPGRRLAIMVHGCFWHRHTGCPLAYSPKSRVDFWQAKFDRNVARDRDVRRALAALGWRVHVIWECLTRDPPRLERHLLKFLGRSRRPAPRRPSRPDQ